MDLDPHSRVAEAMARPAALEVASVEREAKRHFGTVHRHRDAAAARQVSTPEATGLLSRIGAKQYSRRLGGGRLALVQGHILTWCVGVGGAVEPPMGRWSRRSRPRGRRRRRWRRPMAPAEPRMGLPKPPVGSAEPVMSRAGV